MNNLKVQILNQVWDKTQEIVFREATQRPVRDQIWHQVVRPVYNKTQITRDQVWEQILN